MTKKMIVELAKDKGIVEALQRLSAKRPLTGNEAEVLQKAAKLTAER